MPRGVLLAIGLLWLTVLLSIFPLIYFVELVSARFLETQAILMFGVAILMSMIPLVLTVLIQRRHMWARIAYALYFLIGGPMDIWSLAFTWQAISMAMVTKSIAEILLPLVALILLFRPAANSWFRS